jgi:hypothetical protein
MRKFVRTNLSFFGHLEHADLTNAQIEPAKERVRRRRGSSIS